jgi:hypothetical protein
MMMFYSIQSKKLLLYRTSVSLASVDAVHPVCSGLSKLLPPITGCNLAHTGTELERCRPHVITVTLAHLFIFYLHPIIDLRDQILGETKPPHTPENRSSAVGKICLT